MIYRLQLEDDLQAVHSKLSLLSRRAKPGDDRNDSAGEEGGGMIPHFYLLPTFLSFYCHPVITTTKCPVYVSYTMTAPLGSPPFCCHRVVGGYIGVRNEYADRTSCLCAPEATQPRFIIENREALKVGAPQTTPSPEAFFGSARSCRFSFWSSVSRLPISVTYSVPTHPA